MIDLVIPYFAAGAKKDELKFALRSFEQNLKSDFRLVIIGDLPSFIDQNKILFIHKPKMRSSHFPKCYDTNNKIDSIIISNQISEKFILSYDDVLLIKKTSIAQISDMYAIKPLDSFSNNVYKKIIFDTLAALNGHRLGSVNYETHLPRILDKKLMIKTYQTFKPIRHRLTPFTLYFNQHFPDKKVKYLDEFPFTKAVFNSFIQSVSITDPNVLKKIKRYRFLNFDDSAYTPQFEQTLQLLFPNKSKFEF